MLLEDFTEQIKMFESNGWDLDEKIISYLWKEFGRLSVEQWEKIVNHIIKTKHFSPKIADFFKAKSDLKIYESKENVDLNDYYIRSRDYYHLPDKLHIGGDSDGDSKANMINGIWILEREKELPIIEFEHLSVLHKFARKLEIKQWIDICKKMKTTDLKMLVNAICKELDND